MSVIPADSLPVPAVGQSQLPPQISNGTPAQKAAYAVALGFEQVLVTQLAQQLTDTSQSGSASSDGASDGTREHDIARKDQAIIGSAAKRRDSMRSAGVLPSRLGVG